MENASGLSDGALRTMNISQTRGKISLSPRELSKYSKGKEIKLFQIVKNLLLRRIGLASPF
jgi:hypothetical protein